MDLINITPDKEKAKNLLKMAKLLEKRLTLQDRNTMTALIITDYYEIIKELTTAILLTDGHKTLSHKDLFNYLKEKYPEFNEHESHLLTNLRVLRNRIAYEGLDIEQSYLTRNEATFKTIILKLKKTVKGKL